VLTDTNAGSLLVKGVELETVARPIKNLSIGVNYAYTDGEYDKFTGCAAGGLDCSGNPVVFAPPNDLKVFVDYTWNLPSGALVAHIDDQWASTTAVNPVAFHQPGGQPLARDHTKKSGILNASLAYEPTGAKWRVQLWAKNLTNRWYMAAPSNYYFYYLTTAEFAAGLREVDRGVINPPRQIGATFTYRFE